MTAEQLAAIRRMKSMPTLLEFEASNIDAEAGVLRDVVMVQEGEAKGHGFHLEAEFIADLVRYDNKVYGQRGVKARLGHPGMSDDTMGAQMGYFQNFRERKKKGKMQAIADLHLLESADVSPTKPQMRQWVIGMADEAPDFIMSSIVFRPGRYYQRQKDGKKKYVYEYTKVKGDDGTEYDKYVSSDPALGKVFIEFGDRGEHYYTDLVESGAATESLFSNTANPHLFVSRLGEWLDENPDIRTFIHQHPDKVQAFLDRVGFTPKKHPARMSSLKEILFGKEKPADETALSAEEIQSLRDSVAKADTALAEADKKIEALSAEVKALQSGLAETEKQRDALNDKVAELEKKAADVHTRVSAETPAPEAEHSWTKDAINQRAARAFAAMPKKTAAN